MIITRLQIQRSLRNQAFSADSSEYKSIQDAASKIYGENGPLGFYVGLLPDTAKTIADSFLFFLAYNFIRQKRIRSSKSLSKHLSVADELTVGFVAGAFSKFITTPIANIVTRKQTSSMLSHRSGFDDADLASIRSIARRIRVEKGWQGFWSGYSASLVLTLNPSLTFFFFESLKRALIPRDQRASPSTQATFLLAAMSKAMASTITYPFSLAKSRLQANGTNIKHGESSAKSEDVSFEGRRQVAEPPGNVFAMILQIARTEGISALYEGLSGEVLKGFFSHGITMIVKEAVHRVVIRLYYTILKLLRKYPSPQELAEMAMDRVEQVANEAEEKAQQAVALTKDGLQEVSMRRKTMMNEAAGKAIQDPGE